MNARIAGFSLVALLAMLAAQPAMAQRKSSLSWVRLAGAEHCISTQFLAQRVEERIGRRVFVSASEADLSLEGHVQREGNAFVARLVVSDPSGNVLGERVLRVSGGDCAALEASLVLVIAIGIDPNAALPAEAHANESLTAETRTMLAQLELPKLSDDAVLQLAVPSPDTASHPAAVRGEPERARIQATPRTSARSFILPESPAFSVAIHTGVAAEFGVLPAATFGLALRITLNAPSLLPIELSLSGFLPRTQRVDALTDGEFHFWTGGLAICPDWLDRGALGIRLCAGGRAGVLESSGNGFAKELSSGGAWIDATVSAGPTLRLTTAHGFWLDLLGRLSVPFVRDTFVYQDFDRRTRAVHRAAPLVGGVELGAGYDF